MKKLLNKLVNDEDLSKELTQLIDTANAPIFGVDTDGNVNAVSYTHLTLPTTPYV